MAGPCPGVLIAGTTAFDAHEAALCPVMNEWTSGNSHADRVAHINGTSGGGLNTGIFLQRDDGPGETVFTHNDVDALTGSSGQNWFFANQIADNGGPIDTVTDKARNEIFSDTDFSSVPAS